MALFNVGSGKTAAYSHLARHLRYFWENSSL